MMLYSPYIGFSGLMNSLTMQKDQVSQNKVALFVRLTVYVSAT